MTGRTLIPLGDSAMLVRFGTQLSAADNSAAVAFARQAREARLPGVLEVAPNLVSVLLRYDPRVTGFDALAGEIRLLPPGDAAVSADMDHRIAVRFDGSDLAEVAGLLGMQPARFVAAHNAAPLRVLATGFAPGFVYCGFHPQPLHLPRRAVVRRSVPAGTVLFAAGQTAIAATPIPTGWHVIGHTDFRNFDPDAEQPTRLAAGDRISFEALA